MELKARWGPSACRFGRGAPEKSFLGWGESGVGEADAPMTESPWRKAPRWSLSAMKRGSLTSKGGRNSRNRSFLDWRSTQTVRTSGRKEGPYVWVANGSGSRSGAARSGDLDGHDRGGANVSQGGAQRGPPRVRHGRYAWGPRTATPHFSDGADVP